MKTDIIPSAKWNQNSYVCYITRRFNIFRAERARLLVGISKTLETITSEKTPIIRRYSGYVLVRYFSVFFPTFTTRHNSLDKSPERDESPRWRGVYTSTCVLEHRFNNFILHRRLQPGTLHCVELDYHDDGPFGYHRYKTPTAVLTVRVFFASHKTRLSKKFRGSSRKCWTPTPL